MLKNKNIIQPYNNKNKYLQIILIPLMLIGFQALSFLVSSEELESNIISIFYRAFFVLVCIIIITTYSIKKKIFNQNYILFIFWFIYLCRGFYDSTLNPQSIKSMILMFWLFAFFLAFIPMIALLASINIRTLLNAKKLFFVLAVIVNVLSLINNISLIFEGNITRYMSNQLINSITYGQSGLALVIISFSYFNTNLNKSRYLFLIMILLGLVNMTLASSRGPIIELIIVSLVFLISNANKFKFRYLIFIPPLFYLFFSQYSEIINVSNVIDRLNSTNLEEERINIFMDSWNRFIDSPIIGSRAIGEWAHNIFLGSLESLGIIGFILMIIIYKNSIKRSFVLVKYSSTNWLALLLIMYLVSALVTGGIWNSIILWALIALNSNLYYNIKFYKDI